MTRRRPPQGRRGLTLLELMVSLTILSVLTYALASALDLSYRARGAVVDGSRQNRMLRRAAEDIADHLRVTTATRMELSDLADGNHQLTLELPIVVADELAWGLPARLVPGGPADAPDWSLRYTVLDLGPERILVRQVLDDAGNRRQETTLLEGLEAGAGARPGFRVEPSGELWRVTLTLAGPGGRSETIHVWTRN